VIKQVKFIISLILHGFNDLVNLRVPVNLKVGGSTLLAYNRCACSKEKCEDHPFLKMSNGKKDENIYGQPDQLAHQSSSGRKAASPVGRPR
jgi:hypothetical protein